MEVISEFLSQAVLPREVSLITRETVTSTSTELIALAKNGAAEYTLLTARTQYAGHGQHSRPFFSPSGGVYFSLLLRPDLRPDIAESVTLTAAVAVCEVCEAAFGVTARIKPVNDVLVNNKKVSGILAEAFDGPEGFFVVLGIGVNLTAPRGGFPEHLPNAGAVTELPPDSISDEQLFEFTAAVVTQFLSLYRNDIDTVRREYAARVENMPYKY